MLPDRTRAGWPPRSVAGGSGASAAKDGVDGIETDATNCMNLPAEALELDAPIRVHRVALRRDSGGAGAQRGGLGIVREYEILHGEVRFTHRGERHFVAPRGRAGGGDGAMARTVIYRAAGGEEHVPSKLVTSLLPGDRVVFEFGGCTLRVTIGVDGTSAADPVYEGARCTWDMGAPVGPVALSPLTVNASVTETELTLDWSATAPPPEEGANPAQVTWTFSGTRR